MAATTLTSLPSAFRAGDTLLLLINLPDYPASTWTLAYSFRCKDGTAINITGTASGDAHSFTVAASTTAQWVDGDYFGQGRVSAGGQKFTVWEGYLQILPDITVAADNYDTRSHNQKCLDSINLVLEGKAGRDVLTSTIAGQSISRMSFAELIAAKTFYQSLVDAEQDAIKGGPSKRNIVVRFGNP